MAERRFKRRFSKALVVLNCLIAWLVLIAATLTEQAEVVIAHILLFIASMTGIYTGIGHLDYRTMIFSQKQSPEASSDV